MARQRNFAAEYAARIARGIARGFGRQEARGHGVTPEHPGRPAPKGRPVAAPRPPATQQVGNARRGEGLRTAGQARRALAEFARAGSVGKLHILVRRRSGAYVALTAPQGWTQATLETAMRQEGGWQRLLKSLLEKRYPGANRTDPINFQETQLVAY